MSTACIVISDVTDSTTGTDSSKSPSTAMSVVFDGGFDQTSPAHAAIRRVLEMIDALGMEIIEPDSPESTQPRSPIFTGSPVDNSIRTPNSQLIDQHGNTIE